MVFLFCLLGYKVMTVLMPINVFQIYMCIPCNKSIVLFIHKFYYILKKIVMLCITLACRRGSRPDGARYVGTGMETIGNMYTGHFLLNPMNVQ